MRSRRKSLALLQLEVVRLENCNHFKLLYSMTRNSRFCTKEITINGIRIPKNIHVDIPVYGLTRDPEHWDEPSEFRPERYMRYYVEITT